jgi:hypothetical protein
LQRLSVWSGLQSQFYFEGSYRIGSLWKIGHFMIKGKPAPVWARFFLANFDSGKGYREATRDRSTQNACPILPTRYPLSKSVRSRWDVRCEQYVPSLHPDPRLTSAP